MNIRLTMLTAACALALAGCADKSEAPAEPATPAAEAPAAPAEAPAAEAPAPAAEAPAGAAAVVADCATTIESTDAMQYNAASIAVPASCAEFTINLKHTGTMPVGAMGHNLVISAQSDMAGVLADGIAAGATSDYVKADDARVIAHTKLIGGGESTSVTFPVSKLQGAGPFEFFCSFPGHSAMMKGSIAVQ